MVYDKVNGGKVSSSAVCYLTSEKMFWSILSFFLFFKLTLLQPQLFRFTAAQHQPCPVICLDSG